MLIQTKGKFGNIRHTRSNFSSEPIAKTKKDVVQDKRIKGLQKKVKHLEKKPELRYFDTYSTTALLSTGALVCLNTIGQGDDYNQRAGEQVYSKFLSVRMRLTRPVGSSSDIVRVIVFWDKQFNGTGGSVDALVDGLLDNTTITNLHLAPFNHRCNERYKVLQEKVFIFNPNSNATEEAAFAKFNINLHGVKVNYADSGATFASITDKGLLFYVSSSNTAIVPQFCYRYWFTDQ